MYVGIKKYSENTKLENTINGLFYYCVYFITVFEDVGNTAPPQK